MNFYNDIDKNVCAWTAELIKSGIIPEGVVSDTPIQELKPHELTHYTQCHFFNGISGWSRALKLAGIGSDFRCWTGSCPCQPFSAAGNQRGMSDERHLWPAFAHLIRECRPPVVLGEQVASAIAHGWLDTVASDLEAAGYAFGSAILGAHSVGAPHKRQRLYWGGFAVADAKGGGLELMRGESGAGSERYPNSNSEARPLGHPDDEGPQGRGLRSGEEPDELNPWTRGVAVVECTDGEKRLVKPGSFPLAHGVSGRVGLLRGYGNAIVPQTAAAFIEAAVGAMQDMREAAP